MKTDSAINTREMCRHLRKNQTEAEVILWTSLRNRRLVGVKFRRQYPIEGYILDFYCPERKLGIEIDGGVHQNKEQRSYDQERTRVLQENDNSILRLWNSDVINDLSKVVNSIINALQTPPKKVLPLSIE